MHGIIKPHLMDEIQNPSVNLWLARMHDRSSIVLKPISDEAVCSSHNDHMRYIYMAHSRNIKMHLVSFYSHGSCSLLMDRVQSTCVALPDWWHWPMLFFFNSHFSRISHRLFAVFSVCLLQVHNLNNVLDYLVIIFNIDLNSTAIYQ